MNIQELGYTQMPLGELTPRRGPRRRANPQLKPAGRFALRSL